MALSHQISAFAEANSQIASRQQTARLIPARLPTEREVGGMLKSMDHVKQLLEQVGEIQASLRSKRSRAGARPLRRLQEHVVDVSAGMMKPQYVVTSITEPQVVSLALFTLLIILTRYR